MNFKDIYKSANNRVHADESIIDKIFESKSKASPFIRVFASVAACLAIITVILSGNILIQNDKSGAPISSVVLNNKSASRQKNDTKASDNCETADTGAGTKPLYDDIKQDTDKTISETDVMPAAEADAATTVPEQKALMMTKKNSAALQNSISSSDYFKYIGFGIKEDANFSNNIVISFPESYYISRNDSTGEVYDDSAVFTFTSLTSPEIAASLTVGKTNPPRFSGENSVFVNGYEAFIENSDGNFSVILFINDAWASLLTAGMDYEDTVKLLTEILDNKICQ